VEIAAAIEDEENFVEQVARPGGSPSATSILPACSKLLSQSPSVISIHSLIRNEVELCFENQNAIPNCCSALRSNCHSKTAFSVLA
jgi:hypothetical protein